ncbi:MAG: hypothetical protein QOC54_2757, partial [Baekduia sp.]|nr:hypothetical protein [Baekduia sp.]
MAAEAEPGREGIAGTADSALCSAAAERCESPGPAGPKTSWRRSWARPKPPVPAVATATTATPTRTAGRAAREIPTRLSPGPGT